MVWLDQSKRKISDLKHTSYRLTEDINYDCVTEEKQQDYYTKLSQSESKFSHLLAQALENEIKPRNIAIAMKRRGCVPVSAAPKWSFRFVLTISDNKQR